MKYIKHIFSFIFVIFFFQISNAQFTINNGWDHIFIEDQSQILNMQSESHLSDVDVVKGNFDKDFKPFDLSFISGKESYNWFKIEINNLLDKPLDVYLGTNRFEKIVSYQSNDSSAIISQISGSLIPKSEKPVPIEGLSFFKYHLNPGITKVYIKTINTNAPITPQFSFPLILCDEVFFQNNYQKTSDYTFLFLGAIGIMFLYNFILFIVTGQKSFLYYSGYVFFVSLFVLGLVPQFAFKMYGHMDINKFPISSAGTMSSIFYILFGMEIMEVKKYYPRVQKFLTLLIVFLIVALLSVFEGFVVISSFLNFLAAFLMSPTLLILGFLMVLKKHKPGTIFFIANIIFIIGLLVFLFTLTNVLPTIFLGFSGINIYQICLLISLALYSIGIASKINEINELSHQKELESIRAQQLSIENKEISKEKKKAEKALNDLKATQALLIQNEKMASFGELTAGIAHEIQNPLNFVNNFSEISVELSDELQIEANKPDFDRDLIIDLAKDLKNNQEKINLHGKRASSIVKGMLEHSRKSSGTKEATDLNVLADEYLRLAYHGLRAKDKSFNAKFQSELDEKMPLVEVIPQDMGRVILNLITNAFYAVNDKSKKSDKGYEPTVIIGTKLLDKSNIIITVKDNGSGIPDDIKDKIFQPFFTTKPTGQSTGLGLSLAYDIVKAHGGLLKVESKEGVGTEFIIQLPLSA